MTGNRYIRLNDNMKEKIIIKIQGGLGNQMFQYALGISLAQDSSKKVYFDADFYQQKHFFVTPWSYALDYFNTHPEIIHLKITTKVKNVILDILTRIKPELSTYYLRNMSPQHLQTLISKVGNFYLDGYWQNEQFFIHHQDLIRSEFKIITPINAINKKWMECIQKENSVCVHIRRGDYVSDPRANKHHGTCSVNYYEQAIEYMQKHVDNPVYFIFSDDLNWVKENIPIPSPCYYMDHNNTDKNYDDLYLMSNCKYFIIANSSFSWWGAWLSNYSNKIVIAPNRWTNDLVNTVDIIPDAWIRI